MENNLVHGTSKRVYAGVPSHYFDFSQPDHNEGIFRKKYRGSYSWKFADKFQAIMVGTNDFSD